MEGAYLSGILRVGFGLLVMVANLIALVILIKCKKMAFQIRILTIQLAVTDFLFGLYTLMMGVRISSFFPFLCHINYHARTTVSYMTCFVITTMSADRFLALCFPIKYRRIVTSRRVLYLSTALWFSSVLFSLLTYAWMKTITGKTDCKFIIGRVSKAVPIQHISLMSLVILLNICFYIGVACALLCRKDNLQNARSNGQQNHMKQQRRILMKILAITGVFIITYLPYNVMMIIITVDYEHWKRYMDIYFSSTLLVMSNSIISPVVYVLRYPECRYTLMAYCMFWNKEKQQELTEG